MNRPTLPSLAIAASGGIAHVTVVLGLLAHVDYTAVEPTVWIAIFAALTFVNAAVPLLVSAHTRLLAPACAFLALLLGVTAIELSAPGESAYLNMYVMSIFTEIGIGLLLILGVAEFGIRRGYDLGGRRLRNLPDMPLSPSRVRYVVTRVGGLFGFTAGVVGFFLTGFGGLVILALATAAAAVPLAAVLRGGFVTPLVPFLLYCPYTLYLHVFDMTISGMGLVLFGPVAVLSWIAWKIEKLLRSRYLGWNGRKFVRQPDSE